MTVSDKTKRALDILSRIILVAIVAVLCVRSWAPPKRAPLRFGATGTPAVITDVGGGVATDVPGGGGGSSNGNIGNNALTQTSTAGATAGAQVVLAAPLDYSALVAAGSGYTTIATVASGLATTQSVEVWFNVTMRGLGANSIYQSQFSQQAIVANLAGTLTDLTGTLSAGVLATDYTQASMQSVGLPGALVKITGSGTSWVVQCKPPAGVDVVCAVDGLQYTAQRARQPLAYVPSTGVSPTTAVVSTPVTVTVSGGENLATVTGCTINSLACTSVSSATDTGFTFTSPAGLTAGSYAIVVTGSSPTAFPTSYTIPGVTFVVTSSIPAPTLTALANPLLAPAAGSGVAVTLVGTGLSGVTTVTVGSATAAPSSTTATTVTVVLPANTASATAYSLSVTSAGGTSNVLTSAVYYVPSSIVHLWYAAQGFTAGSWIDLVGGANATTMSGMNAPTLLASWTNGRPGVTFDGTDGLGVALGNVAQTSSIFWLGDNHATGGSGNAIFFDAVGASNRWVGRSGGTGGYSSVQIYQGAFVSGTPGVQLTTPSLLEFKFAGASASVAQNNGAAFCSGNAGSGTVFSGISIGSPYDGETTLTQFGHTGLLAIYSGTSTSGDQAIIHGIAQSIMGIP